MDKHRMTERIEELETQVKELRQLVSDLHAEDRTPTMEELIMALGYQVSYDPGPRSVGLAAHPLKAKG